MYKQGSDKEPAFIGSFPTLDATPLSCLMPAGFIHQATLGKQFEQVHDNEHKYTSFMENKLFSKFKSAEYLILNTEKKTP